MDTKNFFFVTVLIFIFRFSENVESAKVLAVFPFPGKSHYLMFEKILIGLVEKGHQVDVYSFFPQKVPIKGFNDISLEGTTEISTGNVNISFIKQYRSPWSAVPFLVRRWAVDNCKTTLASKQMALLKNSSKTYDILITELFASECMLGWAWHFNIPSVLMTSSANFPWASDIFGFSDNPAYIPTYYSDVTPKMNLFDRVYNTVVNSYAKFYYRLYSQEPVTKIARSFFGEEMPHLADLARNCSLQLVNAHFSINHARPLTPNVIDVAGVQIEEPKPLNEHFSKLVELAPGQKGVIYFTLGSLIQTELLPEQQLQGMFNAFARLPYKVLWKARHDRFSKNLTIPDNINFEWWMPQSDILCHPNTKLYISHGGNMGIQESVYCGVPVLGLPLFADQPMNLAQVVYLGTAITTDFYDLTEEDLYNSAYELLNKPSYQQSAKILSKIFKDRPMKALDTAVYWIDYVIRHEGAPHLRSTATELYWYQYVLLDVLLVLVGGPFLSVYVVYCILRTCRFGRNGSRKDCKSITKKIN